MRKVIYALTNSLDSYIARTDGVADWILMDEEIDFGQLVARFDTVLIGRKTYEYTAQQNPGAEQGSGDFMGIKTYVFSRTLQQSPPAGVNLVSAGAADFVRQLKQAEGKDIWLMGGGLLAASLLQARLVDEIELTLQPILLGTGVPLFPAFDGQVELQLRDCKTYKSGLVGLSYAVKN